MKGLGIFYLLRRFFILDFAINLSSFYLLYNHVDALKPRREAKIFVGKQRAFVEH
jgi:hypothetical protein